MAWAGMTGPGYQSARGRRRLRLSTGLEALGQDGRQHGAHAGCVEAAEVAEQGVLVGLEAVAGELEGGERQAQFAAVEQQEGLF